MVKWSIFAAAGLIVLGLAGFLSRWGGARPMSAGRLVPRDSLLVWHGPSELKKGQAKVQFVLDNPGQTAVRILSVESGCGCTIPSYDPEIIPPGGRGLINARAEYFPVGERRVPIAVNTDSAATPKVSLTLHLIGGGGASLSPQGRGRPQLHGQV